MINVINYKHNSFTGSSNWHGDIHITLHFTVQQLNYTKGKNLWVYWQYAIRQSGVQPELDKERRAWNCNSAFNIISMTVVSVT